MSLSPGRLSPGKVKHMDALSNDKGVIAAAAMDQRGSLAKSLAAAKGVSPKEITDEMMSEFKTAVTRILTPYASAILLEEVLRTAKNPLDLGIAQRINRKQVHECSS